MSSNDQPLLQVWGSDICELLAGAVDADKADSQNQQADASQQNDDDDCISVVSYNDEATEEVSAGMANSDRIMAWLEDASQQNDAVDCTSVVSYSWYAEAASEATSEATSTATEGVSADMYNSDRIMAWLEDVQEGVYEEDWSMYSRQERGYAAADFFFSEFELESEDFEAMLKKDGELIGADENTFDLDYLKFSRRNLR